MAASVSMLLSILKLFLHASVHANLVRLCVSCRSGYVNVLKAGIKRFK